MGATKLILQLFVYFYPIKEVRLLDFSHPFSKVPIQVVDRKTGHKEEVMVSYESGLVRSDQKDTGTGFPWFLIAIGIITVILTHFWSQQRSTLHSPPHSPRRLPNVSGTSPFTQGQTSPYRPRMTNMGYQPTSPFVQPQYQANDNSNKTLWLVALAGVCIVFVWIYLRT